MRAVDHNFALMAAGIAAIIVYGSLFPFQFHYSHPSAGLLRSLLDTWRTGPGRGDFLANVLLYLPYGLFSVAVLRRWPAAARIVLSMCSGLVLSTSLELTQFYVPGRIPALSDVYSDTLGSLLGAAGGALVFSRSRRWPRVNVQRRPFVFLLLASWLGYRLFPYVPTIDLHKYWAAVKPLLFSPSLTPLDLYRHAIVWLAVALLLEAIVGELRSRVALLILMSAVLGARIFILDALLSPAEVGGAVLTLMAWSALLWRLQIRARIVAALFAGLVVLQALEPFQFTGATHTFQWIPFVSFLRGSTEINIRSFLEKAFTYGALVWLIARAGCTLAMATGLSGGLVLCLRLLQVFLPGRSAEITDTFMVLLLAGAMKLLGEEPTRTAASETPARRSMLSRLYERLTRNDPVQPVDLIFVAAGRMERKHFGVELYRAGVAPRLILSVGRFEVSKIGNLDAGLSDGLIALRQATPPDERHFFVEMSAAGSRMEKVALPRWSTYGEALALRRFLENSEVRKVMVISSDVHLRRVALTYAQVLRGLPVELRYCAVPARFGSPMKQEWWTRAEDRNYVLKETLKLAGYRLILWGPRFATPWLMRVKA